MPTVKAWAVTAVFAGAVLLAGCGNPSTGEPRDLGGSGSPPSQPGDSVASTPGSALTPTSLSGPGPSAGLLGQYTTTFTGNEQYVPPSEPKVHLISFANPGPWTLSLSTTAATFGPQGGPALQVGPRWSHTANEVVFAAGCPFQELEQPPTPGVYTYTLRGSTLTFVEVSDSCLYRAAYLSAHPWHRT